ncbi:MAG: type III-B CRISPR module-associated protein Cmr3 [Victivallaceae bacterium]|nr:type III-B CRISPR module-associated protein Cmr3 [Victivallaceae bacterium]
MCYELEIHPRDVLYFRDGRPLGGSNDGSGAMWPQPSIFHSAMLGALHGSLGSSIGQWESNHHVTEKEAAKKSKVRFQFGGLKTWGPFPKKNDKIFVPTPADLLPAEENLSDGVAVPLKLPTPSDLQSANCATNLPVPLKYPVGSFNQPSKATLGGWISMDELYRYLEGKVKGLQTVDSKEFYSEESRPGIGIDSETGVTQEHMFYSAEYLRLTEGTSMAAFAECFAKKYDGTETDVLKELFQSTSQTPFIFGGQRGMAYLECCRDKRNFPEPDVSSTCIKWVLLTPAYFEHGWIPSWVNMEHNENFDPGIEQGRVMLKEKVERGAMMRDEWRRKIAIVTPVGANLVAARIPKPVAVSGWKLDKDADCAGGEAKPTRLYVPAGAVYYFKCDSSEGAKKLVALLHGQTKSDRLGEQGFGLGICGTWNFKSLTNDGGVNE